MLIYTLTVVKKNREKLFFDKMQFYPMIACGAITCKSVM